MHISVVTTSFPLTAASTSGVFVKRMVEQLPKNIEATIITPADTAPRVNSHFGQHHIAAFRYGPRSFQRIAHQPGGVLTALATNQALYLLLPFFLLALFWQCLLTARKSSLIQANWSINGVIAGFAGLLTGTPVITTLHGSDVSRLEQSAMSRVMLRLCHRLSARLVAVGENQKQLISRQYPHIAARIEVIPNGISKSFLQVGEGREYSSHKRLRLITVGNLIPLKGIDTLVEAIAMIPIPAGLSLSIVGDGPERENLQAQCRDLHVSDHVRFLGSVPADDIPQLLEQADVLVMPSLREGRPSAVLEAMAAGLAIIGTDIAPIRELVTDDVNGLFFPPSDAQQLAQKISRFIKEPELCAEFGIAAHADIARGDFTWQACAEQYADLFKKTLVECSAQD